MSPKKDNTENIEIIKTKMENRGKIIVALITALSVVLAATIPVIIQQHSNNVELEDTNTALQESLSSLQTENDVSKNDYSALKSENEKLSNECATLKADKAILNASNESLKSQNDKLTKDIADLQLANDELQKKVDEYSAMIITPDDTTTPVSIDKSGVSLSTIPPINGGDGWEWNSGTPTDPFGVTHTNVSNFLIRGGKHASWVYSEYAEYRVYHKYNKLTGYLISYKDIGEDGNSQIKIYADDELVYVSPNIERKTDLLSFEADIKNSDYIKLEIICDKGSIGWSDTNGDCLILMDVQLIP